MNKSKFLKKSLAAVLAVLMVVAMIPLSAAAASTGYTPTGLKITGPNGEVATPTAEKNRYELNLKWDSAAPTITISTETADDEMWAVVGKVDTAGNPVGSQPTQMNSGNNPATGNLEMEDDGTPIPFRFFVKNSGEQSDDITVTWTRESASTSGRATEATLAGQFKGDINDNAKTITFTVPFGYAGAKTYEIKYDGCANSVLTRTHNTQTGTNQKKPVGMKVFNETQDGKTPVEYEVIVKEETGLTEFKVGDLKTEFVIASADSATDGVNNSPVDKGMQTGVIKVYVPSTLEPVNSKVELIPTFKISDPNTNVTIQNGSNSTTNIAKAESGKKFDFSYAYCGVTTAVATSQLKTGVELVLTSTGGAKRTYQLVFVRNEDTELTSVKAEPGTGNAGTWGIVDGDISGSNIEVVVPKGADLSKIKLTFTGPRGFDSTASVKIGAKNDTFDENGVQDDASKFAVVNCTSPLSVVVKSDDGKHQKVYTLTVKAIDEDSVAPAITSGVLVLNKGTSDETPYNASISGTTITFTVPHSADDTIIGQGVYTWVRNSKATTLDATTGKPTTFKDGGWVQITSASGNAVRYQIKFARLPAETGKVISDMRLTEATNTNLIGYNNHKTYNVTISGGKFTVTMPSAEAAKAYQVDFKLSKGAKLFQYATDTGIVNTTAIAHADDDGTNMSTVTANAANTGYFVADETLATMIRDVDAKITKGGSIDWPTINREFGSHKVDYIFDVKASASNNTLLTSVTDRDGFVTSKIEGLKAHRTITLTVPASYVVTTDPVDGDRFGLNFKTADPNAKVSVYHSASDNYEVFPSGHVSYTNKKITYDSFAWVGNVGFAFFKNVSGKVDLRMGTTGNFQRVINPGETAGTDGYSIRVTAENGDTEDYTIKEIKIADAEQGAQVTELTVNGKKADIDQNKKTITAYVDYGTNLGQIDIALKASKMAKVTMPNDVTGAAKAGYDKDVAATYDLRYPIKIKVESESATPRVTNTYTLTVKTGEQFSDVPANAWFAPYVKEAVEKGIVTGRGDNTFGPYDDITRQDFALMTVRMLGLEDTIDKDATVPFTDASSVSDYAKAAVAYCAKEGIIGGYEDSTFRPQGKITREEAAKILAEALELEIAGTPTFVDTNRISSWARPYVAAVQTAKIFTGDEAGRFNGTTRITRAETAKVMVESLKIK